MTPAYVLQQLFSDAAIVIYFTFFYGRTNKKELVPAWDAGCHLLIQSSLILLVLWIGINLQPRVPWLSWLRWSSNKRIILECVASYAMRSLFSLPICQIMKPYETSMSQKRRRLKLFLPEVILDSLKPHLNIKHQCRASGRFALCPLGEVRWQVRY